MGFDSLTSYFNTMIQIFLKEMILTLGLITVLAGISSFVFQVAWPIGFVIAGVFFLMHKLVTLHGVILARWRIEQETKDNDSKH